MSRKVDRYIGPILHFLIYRHRPISVFSSADLKSGMFAGSPVLLVRWNVLLLHVKDLKPKLLEDSITVLGDTVKDWHKVGLTLDVRYSHI